MESFHPTKGVRGFDLSTPDSPISTYLFSFEDIIRAFKIIVINSLSAGSDSLGKFVLLRALLIRNHAVQTS